jgi:DNA-binding NtrC family response regulator
MEYEILVMDDKREDAEAAAAIVSELAHVKTTIVTDPDKALELINRNPSRFALILQDLNLNLKHIDGIGLAKKIWKINPSQLIAIFSGQENVDSLVKCVGTPIVEFIRKGGPATITQKKVSNLLQKYAALAPELNLSAQATECQALCQSVGLVSTSPLMAAAVNDLKKIAASDATLLIRGGSGTGKEMIARSTHNLSPRKAGPFIGLNMTAITSTLIESELFGHEKGSFTGANSSRQGAFVRANGGTIFMDEIGDLPMELQVKLLRVIQEREVHPIGASDPIKIDVRIIAATHTDLEARIKSGQFRLDLFQRINVLTLQLPGLNERLEDIPLLASHFFQKHGSKKTLTQAAIKELQKYDWPGNVRELENIIQRIIALVDDKEILANQLPPQVFATTKIAKSNSGVDFSVGHAAFMENLHRIEKEYLIHNLSKSKSVRDAALNHMLMSPSTLRDRMDFHKISFNQKESQQDSIAKQGEINETAI